ncbi:hypothetical protein ACTMU2_19210 [Cupriavidus basilensis]
MATDDCFIRRDRARRSQSLHAGAARPHAACQPDAGGSVAPATLDPTHAYALPELIDLAESTQSADAHRLERRARRRRWLPASQRAATCRISRLRPWAATKTGHSSTSTALGTAGASSSTHGAISVLSLQWLLFDFGERSGTCRSHGAALGGGEYRVHGGPPEDHPRRQRRVLPLPGRTHACRHRATGHGQCRRGIGRCHMRYQRGIGATPWLR